jgi:hypothetical protein
MGLDVILLVKRASIITVNRGYYSNVLSRIQYRGL